MPAFLLRVPDHLGDGVMAIPAVQSIATLGAVQIVGPSWAERLYGDLQPCGESPETAVLFKSSFSAAWAARRLERRIGTPGDWRRWLLTDVVRPAVGHRSQTYAELAGVLGLTVSDSPRFSPTEAERTSAPKVRNSDVLLLPLSKSQATVGWPHFRALADALGGDAVFAAGPGECAALKQIAGPHRVLPPLPIGEFAVVAQCVRAVVGNDSGLAHLAGAARRAGGSAPQTVHVIFGSTEPGQTGPAGCSPHRGPPLKCQPCYKKKCTVDSAQPPCLDVPLESLLVAVS